MVACRHCGGSGSFIPGSPKGRSGWSHDLFEETTGHDFFPADGRTPQEDREQQKFEQGRLKDIEKAGTTTLVVKPRPIFMDRRG